MFFGISRIMLMRSTDISVTNPCSLPLDVGVENELECFMQITCVKKS